jgi:RNA polymerase sigma-70 factor (ECF subfamily)
MRDASAASPPAEVAVEVPETPPFPADAALVDAIRRNEAGGAEQLYRVLSPTVHRIVCRVVGGRCAESDDIVQTTFEKVIRSIVDGTFGGTCPLKRWAASIALNTAFDYHRRQARERKVVNRDIIDMEVAAALGPMVDGERSLQAREEVAQLSVLLGAMKPRDVEVLLLHHGLGYTVKEVAAVVSSSAEATGSRLIRARRDLLRRAERRGLSVRPEGAIASAAS